MAASALERLLIGDPAPVVTDRVSVPSSRRVVGDQEAISSGLYDTPKTVAAALPKGFRLDAPQDSVALPEGFKLDEPAAQPEKPKDKGLLGYVDDAVRAVASGATFGYADELAAKMDELTGRGGSYEDNLAKERARDKEIPSIISMPGEVGGAVATTLAAAPVAAATKIGQAAANLPKLVRWAGIGGAEGALAGSGNATEGERVQGALAGGAVGAPAGVAAPMFVGGVGRFANSVRNAVSPQSNVAADLGRAITRDADNPAALIARANAAALDRPGVATLADVGGENVRGLVERVAQTPGAGRTQVVPALTMKQQGQAGRLAGDLKELTGTGRSAFQAINETVAARAEASKPLYQKAFEADVSQNPEVVNAFLREIDNGWGKAIINSPALKRTLQTEYSITGNPGPQQLMPVIDAWKRAADDIIREDPGSNKSRVLKGMLDRVISAVDKANPAYAEARAAWSGPTRYLDAIERGKGILGTSETAEQFGARFRALPAAEQEAERIGAVSSIIAKMGNDSAKLGDMTKYLRSPEVRAKVAAIMPNEEAAQSWLRRLDYEVGASEMTGRALGNSATARRLAERQDAESLVGDLVMDAIRGGGLPQNMVTRLITAGPKWLRDTMRSRADAMLADVLTNPESLNKLPQTLQRTIPKASNAGAGSAAAGASLANQ